jgi:hypothetical protein
MTVSSARVLATYWKGAGAAVPGIKMLMVDNRVELGSVGSRRSTTRSDPVGNVHKLAFFLFPPRPFFVSPSGLLSSSWPLDDTSLLGRQTHTTIQRRRQHGKKEREKKIKVHQINTTKGENRFPIWLLFFLFIFFWGYSIGVVKKPEIDSSRQELLRLETIRFECKVTSEMGRRSGSMASLYRSVRDDDDERRTTTPLYFLF